jgi:hypothetical protein
VTVLNSKGRARVQREPAWANVPGPVRFFRNPGLEKGSVDLKFEAVCAVNGRPFGGIVRVDYALGKGRALVPEFDSLAGAVRAIARRAPTTVEHLCVDVKNVLEGKARGTVTVLVTSKRHAPAMAVARFRC